MKRRDLVRELLDAGFVSRKGSKHEVFVKGELTTTVPYHRELNEITVRTIRKQAGLL